MRPDALGRVLVLATACGWGFGWTMMKLLMRDWPPLFARGVSGLIAAAGLAGVALLRGDGLAMPRALVGRIVLGAATSVFAWMGFTALSLLWLHVSEAALLTYTMPIWATLLAWPVLGERPTPRSGVALALGIAGLVVLMGAPVPGAGLARFPGIAFALAAAIFFALGALASRRPMPIPPVVATAWMIALGSAAMLAAGLVMEKPDVHALTAVGAGALAYMAIGPMALCYLAWFAAIARIPARTASTGLLLIPVIGAFSAAFVLGEPLGLRHAAAFALTLGGVALELRR